MGSDEEKSVKKRLKAEYKLEKKRLKAEEDKAEKTADKTDGQPSPEKPLKPPVAIEKQPGQKPIEQPPRIIVNLPKEPWYKDPRWISAIIGAVTLSLALITIFTDWL